MDVQNYFTCPACKRRDPKGRLDQACRRETGLTRFFGSPLLYRDEIVRTIIHGFKYRHAKGIGAPLGEILLEFLDKNNFREIMNSPKKIKGSPEHNEDLPPSKARTEMNLRSKKCLVTPVPLHNFKERERGFNQAGEIAKILARHYGLEFYPRLLKKEKNTGSQADMKSKKARVKNVEEAFTCAAPEAPRGKILILVDDVYTTGATMRECAMTLRKSGAKEVWGITIAR